MTLVAVIHFGDIKMLKICVNSFLENEKDIILLVVNNNNLPMQKLQLASDKRVYILNSKENRGYGGGFNQIISFPFFKKANEVLLTNNDTFITKPILKKLRENLKDRDVGIVGPIVEYREKGKIVFDTGGFINNIHGAAYHKIANKINAEKPYDVDFLGVCLLIKKDVIRLLNGFDENFFLYYEDVDFCLRAKKIGYKVIVDPSALIFHGLSKSVGKDSKLAVYNQTRSAIVYMHKHLNKAKLLFFTYLLMQSLKRFINNPTSGRYAFKAIFENL